MPGVTLAEALSLKLVEENIRSIVPASVLRVMESRFRHANRKLDSMVESSAIANWVDKVRVVPPVMPMLPPRIEQAVLDAVQASLLADKQLMVEYCSVAEKEPKQLLIHPLALVQRGLVTYLVAAAGSHPKPRLYALQRITEARETDKAAVRPEGFNLDDYIESGALNFGKGGQLKLDARIETWLAHHLEETPLSVDQTMVEKEGFYHPKATVSDSWQLRWWILSQGDGVEVYGSDVLRSEVVSSLKSALGGYVD